MKLSPGVFMSDQLTRDGLVHPPSGLMDAYFKHVQSCSNQGLASGMPSHIQHDMHRPIGWSRQLGLYFDTRMVRVLGQLETPETEQEKAAFLARRNRYWHHYHEDASSLYRDDLHSRTDPVDTSGAEFLRVEAVVLKQTGIALSLYPDLFTPHSGAADKDGLARYRDLIQRMRQIQTGVFHDPERDLLLFASAAFRRSHSQRNQLNWHFLQTFEEVAARIGDLSVHLRLDPDIVGHPDSATNLIEQAYWHGPKFSDDIAKIEPGAAHHKASQSTRYFEGIDATQFWWKAPESRRTPDGDVTYRTFEMEELIENETPGLGGDRFGCRYAHAEFDTATAYMTHFDGAVRAYSQELYLERIERRIDRAGKSAHYVKQFRFDGPLPIEDWKALLAHYFRGNPLISEYLNGTIDDDAEPDKAQEDAGSVSAEARLRDIDLIPLAALVTFDPGQIGDRLELSSDQDFILDGHSIPFVEVGTEPIKAVISQFLDLSAITHVRFMDDILNLSTIVFGGNEDIGTLFDAVTQALGLAIASEAAAGAITRAAVPLAWEIGGLVVTLSLAGEALLVSNILQGLASTVDVQIPPPEWAEKLANLIKAQSGGGGDDAVMWDGVSQGKLAIGRSGEVEFSMQFPEDLFETLYPTIAGEDEASDLDAVPPQT